jgi:hypothetical protein
MRDTPGSKAHSGLRGWSRDGGSSKQGCCSGKVRSFILRLPIVFGLYCQLSLAIFGKLSLEGLVLLLTTRVECSYYTSTESASHGGIAKVGFCRMPASYLPVAGSQPPEMAL